MARVRHVVLLFAALCCYTSISDAEENEYQTSHELEHDKLVELASRIAKEVRILELGLGIQKYNEDDTEDETDMIKSLQKRQAATPRSGSSGLPMNVPVKMSGFAFGKRDGQLVRRSAKSGGDKPVKLAGFAFGKRGQPVKRSTNDQLEEDVEEKRGMIDGFTFGKRISDQEGLSPLSFEKRRDPTRLSALTFGKRGMHPASMNEFSFGKRRMDPLSAFSFGKKRANPTGLNAFSFGKRGMDPSALSAFSFGKRGMDPSGLSAFSFGKRMGMNAFTFGKREEEEEERAFEENTNDDEKRAGYNGLSQFTFGKRDTEAVEERLNNDETLRTD